MGGPSDGDDKTLGGKVAIITGSGKNIGKAIARMLGPDGAVIRRPAE